MGVQETNRSRPAHPAAFFRQLPGVGRTLAPRLLVAFGDGLTRTQTRRACRKTGGGGARQRKRGKQLWVHGRWHAPVFLRQSLVGWAGLTVVFCDWAKATIDASAAQAWRIRPSCVHWRSNGWRIFWRCLHSHEPYDDARYVAALKLHHSPLAADLQPSLKAA